MVILPAGAQRRGTSLIQRPPTQSWSISTMTSLSVYILLDTAAFVSKNYLDLCWLGCQNNVCLWQLQWSDIAFWAGRLWIKLRGWWRKCSVTYRTPRNLWVTVNTTSIATVAENGNTTLTYVFDWESFLLWFLCFVFFPQSRSSFCFCFSLGVAHGSQERIK